MYDDLINNILARQSQGAEGSDTNPYPMPAIVTTKRAEKPKETRSFMSPITDYGAGVVSGFRHRIPEMVGQAGQFMGIEAGRELAEWGRKGEEPVQERGAFYQAGEMTPASAAIPMAMNAIGTGLMFVPIPGARVVGGAIKIASYALAPLMFGLSQAQQTKETAEARGVDPGAAPYITGGIEFSGEVVATAALNRLLGPLAPSVPLIKSGAKNLLRTSIVRYGLHMLTNTLPTEIATEVLQQAGEAAVEKKWGIRPDAQPIKEAMSVIAPTAIMTLVSGSAGHAYQRIQANEMLKNISSPDVDPAKRKDVAAAIAGVISKEEKDKEKPVANTWLHYANHQIDNGLPVDIDKPVTELKPGPRDVLLDKSEKGATARGMMTGEDSIDAEEAAAVFDDETLDLYSERTLEQKQAKPEQAAPKPKQPDLSDLEDDDIFKRIANIEKAQKAGRMTKKQGENLAILQQTLVDRGIKSAEESAETEPSDLERLAEADAATIPEMPKMKPKEAPKTEQPTTTLVKTEAPEKAPEAPVDEISAAAQEAATSPENDLQEPTEAQKQAGNYRKGHVSVQGMDISIENPKGSERSGTDKSSKKWSTTMQNHYGYFKRSEGKDGDQIDVFIGSHPESDKAYIVDQVDPGTGKFDEHKTLLGFTNEDEAEKAYLANYEKGWKGLGAITEIPIDEFKKWIDDGKRKKAPFSKEGKADEGEKKGRMVRGEREGEKPGRPIQEGGPGGPEAGPGGILETQKADEAEVKPEKPKTEPEPKPIEAPVKEEKAPGIAQGEAVEGEKEEIPEKVEPPELKKETGVSKVPEKPAPTPEKTEVAPEVKPEPIGKAWINQKQRPIMAAREITRGKDKGKVEVTMTAGRDKEGKVIAGRKVKIPKDSVIEWPGIKEEAKPESKPETKKEQYQIGKSDLKEGELSDKEKAMTSKEGPGEDITTKQASESPMGGETLYHGSSYKFDKFDTSKIDSGQGAQAFGWGLYFTNDPDIAKAYARSLSLEDSAILKVGETVFDRINANLLSKTKTRSPGYSFHAANNWLKNPKNKNKLILALKREINQTKFHVDHPENFGIKDEWTKKKEDLFQLRRAFELIESGEKVEAIPTDRLRYTVKVTHGLDWIKWDEPLSEKQINKIADQAKVESKKLVSILDKRDNGEQLYKKISDYFDSDKKASIFLSRSGIDGIDYPAGTLSKIKGKSRNYIIFDENNIKIVDVSDSEFPSPKPSSPPEEGGQKYARGYDKEGLEKGDKNALYQPQKRDKAEPKERRSKRRTLSQVLKNDGFVGANEIRLLPKITKERKTLQKITGEFGVHIEFFDSTNRNINSLNGVMIPALPDTIFINKNSERPMLLVAGHELTHTIEHRHPDLYEFLINSIRDNTVDFDSYVKNLGIVYSDIDSHRDINKDFALKELVGDFVGHQLTEKSFYEKLYAKSPNLAKRLMNLISKIFNYFAGKTEIQNVKSYIADIEKAQEAVAGVLAEVHERESGKKVTPAKQAGVSKHHLSMFQKQSSRWYSQMRNYLFMKLTNGTPENLAKQIESWANKGAFKQEELEWSGVLDYLRSFDKAPSNENLSYIGVSDFAPSTDLSNRDAIAIPLPGNINIPGYSGFLFDSSLIKSLASDPQNLRNLPNTKTFSEKGFNSIDIKVRRFVMNGVSAASHDPKIFKSIVKFIPIDVMNNLIGKKLSSDAILDNPFMFQKAISTNSDSSVSIRHDMALSSLISNATGDTAKIIDVLFNSAGKLVKIDPAIITRNDHDALQKAVYSAMNYNPDHTESQTKKVTKQQVLDYLDDNNVRIEEVEKKDKQLGFSIRYEENLNQYEVVDNETGDTVEVTETREDAQDYIDNEEAYQRAVAETKFSQYVQPGGKNYRELLLTLPMREGMTIEEASEYEDLLKDKKTGGIDPSQVGRFNELSDKAYRSRQEGSYKSSHWEEPNVLSHVRFDERTGPNGERILHIAEIQSDWHQEGRKKGYDLGKKITTDDIVVSPKQGLRAWVVKFPNGLEMITTTATNESEAKIWGVNYWNKNLSGNVPDAPFKKTWPLLTIKRMVRYASEQGFDKISWDVGSEQVKRYREALQKAVDKIEWTKTKDGIQLVGYKNGKQVVDTVEKENAISDAIGKSMGDSIIESPEQSGTFEGDEITISDTGMAGFYDKILPAEVNKFFGKKIWGSPKVSSLNIGEQKGIEYQALDYQGYSLGVYQTRNEAEKVLNAYSERDGVRGEIKERPIGGEKSQKVHMLPITPEMKSKALSEGMPLFQKTYKRGDEEDWKAPPLGGRKAPPGGKQPPSDILSEEVRKNIGIAKGLPKPGFTERFEAGLEELKKQRAHFPELQTIEDKDERGALNDLLRQHQEVPETAKHKAITLIHSFMKDLSKEDYEAFRMNIILADMVRDINNGLTEDGKLPFGFKTTDEVIGAYERYMAIARENPRVTKALERRNKVINDIKMRLIRAKLLKKEVADEEDYFHHQILIHWQAKYGLATGSKDVRTHWRPWMAKRKGSDLDYNTEYAQVEFMAVSQQLAQLETVDTLKRIKKESDIYPRVKTAAKESNLKNFMAKLRKAGQIETDEFGNEKDPLLPWKQKIAMSNTRLAEMASRGTLEYDSEWTEIVEALADSYDAWKANKDDIPDYPRPGVNDARWFNFLSYLINTKKPGSNWAATVFKAIRGRDNYIKDTLGEDFLTYRNMVPDGYVEWHPDPKKGWFWANTVSDNLLQRLISREIDPTDVEFRKILAKGRDLIWIIPKGLADTMDTFKEFGDPSHIGRLADWAQGAWKQYILLNPYSVVRYNINNMSGDLDATLAYAPEISRKYSLKAAKELWKWHKHKALPADIQKELDRARRLGVVGSGFAVQEVDDVLRIISMDKFVRDVILDEKPNWFNPKTWGQKYWQQVQQVTVWRENILRLAAWRYFKDNADKNLYGASKPDEVNAIKDPEERAAKLARELLGDYGNISRTGEWIRKRMIPFYSWMEINAPRYVYMMRNTKYESREQGSIKGRVAAIGAKKMILGASKMALRASMLYGLVMIWNMVMFPKEEEEIAESGRNQLHIILGRREDGSIITLRFQGALSDALSFFGLEDWPQDIKDVSKGKNTVLDKLKEVPIAFLNRWVQGIRPEIKLFGELISGKAIYPDFRKPIPIRDRLEYALRTFKLDKIYREVLGRPSKGKTPGASRVYQAMEHFVEDLKQVLIYESDPGILAYYDARKMALDWLAKRGDEKAQGGSPTKKGNALYWYKQAMKYGDLDAAQRYLQKYYELGGTQKGKIQSIRLAHPLSSIPKMQRYQFKQSLTPSQRSVMDRAMKWYDETYIKKRRGEE